MNIGNIIHRILMIPINRLESRIKHTNWYCNSIPDIENYPGDKWYRNHLDRNYDVVNIGSSSAVFCFDYDGLGVKAFNWALKPQSMEYSFKVLKQYFSILKQNGIVLIPICPFSSLSVIGKWADCANDKYFHILDKTLIDNYDPIAKRRQHPFISMPLQSIKRLIKDVPQSDMYSYNVQCKSKEDFAKSAECWINLWMKEFNITNLNDSLTEENVRGRKNRIEIVRALLYFCKERDLRPVIVIPPVHPTLNKYFTHVFCKNYIYSFVNELHVKDVKVIDHLFDISFSNNEYFRDAYFMSKIGAKEFTKQVLNELDVIKCNFTKSL